MRRIGYLAVFYDDTDDSKVGMVLVRKDELVCRNDWDAMGLAATGSQTVATDGELFVPDERFAFPTQLAERTAALIAQGLGPRRGGLPRSVMSSAGIALGMADQAMEVFLFLDRQAKHPCPVHPSDRHAVAHHIIGRAAMQIRAVGRVADAAVAEFDRLDAEDADPSEQEDLQFHTDAAYVWDACTTATETYFLLRAPRQSPSACPCS